MTCPFMLNGRCALAEIHAKEELELALECRPSTETCVACLAKGKPCPEKPSIQCLGLVTSQVSGEHLATWRQYIGWLLFDKSRGLGDTVAKFTRATGVDRIAKVVAKATGKDCGCKKRQKALNAAAAYKEQNR